MKSILISLLGFIASADDCQETSQDVVTIIPEDLERLNPGMNVNWRVQKCGSGDMEYHQIIMGGEIYSTEINLHTGNYSIWFTFPVSGGKFSSMVCNVEVLEADDGFAATEWASVDEFYGSGGY